jgi:hypothetical protein
MGSNSLSASNIFLTVIAALYLVANIAFNFTFILILLKSSRFRKIDRSFFLVTHMIIVDFFCAFFIFVMSGYGVYNDSFIEPSSCHVQTYFQSLVIGISFHSLLALSIERFIRYQNPIFHINTFTRRLVYDEEEQLVEVKDKRSWIVFIIIAVIWLLNIFISFFPLFRNLSDILFFNIESQCDYIYEKFPWFLWFFFFVCIVLPFLASMVFFTLTFRLIVLSNNRIKLRKAQFEKEQYGERRGKINEVEHVVPGLDITKQPFNTIYYDHLIDPNEEETSTNNDFHVRNQLLTQYKYDTESGQTLTYCLITIFSFVVVFPVYVIHFYRTYNNDPTSSAYPDNPATVTKQTYTAFVWISYMIMLLKSMFCLIQNGFYRDALYQSANCRGFNGLHDYEKELSQVSEGFLKRLLKKRAVKESKGGKTIPKVNQQNAEEEQGSPR